MSLTGEEETNDGLTRREALKRLGTYGLVATAGAGLLEMVGVRAASAQTGNSGVGNSGSSGAAVPGRSPAGLKVHPEGPDITCPPDYCPAKLAEGKCFGGPCVSGYWCYHTNGGCGLSPGYVCMSGGGRESICYNYL